MSDARIVAGQRGSRPTLADERGQLTILFGVGLITLLMFVTMSINIAQAVVRRQQAQIIADYAALTGATVQGRGLNQMTRMNEFSLRIFNTLSLRSRISGYNNWHTPVVASWIIDIVGLNVPESPIEEDDTFEKFHDLFTYTRGATKALNYLYQVLALQAAKEVTEANVKAMFGGDTWNQLEQDRANLGVLPHRPFISVNGNELGSAALQQVVNNFGGFFEQDEGSILSTFQNGFQFPGTQDWLDMGAQVLPFKGVVPKWADSDGDPLIIRYWTDYPNWFKTTIRAIAFAATFFTCGGCGEEAVNWVFKANNEARFIWGPNWHDMRVTLSRDPSLDGATVFVWWVRLPTTSTSTGSWFFDDLPSVVAFAAAKPVGGNLGDPAAPQVSVLEKAIPGLPGFFGDLEGLLEGVTPARQHLVRGGSSSNPVNRQQMLDNIRQQKEDLNRRLDDGDISVFDYLDMMEALNEAEQGLLSGDGGGGSGSYGYVTEGPPSGQKQVYWYDAGHWKQYQPRLVPIRGRYLSGTGYTNLLCKEIDGRPVLNWSQVRDMLLLNAVSMSELATDAEFLKAITYSTAGWPAALKQVECLGSDWDLGI